MTTNFLKQQYETGIYFVLNVADQEFKKGFFEDTLGSKSHQL